MLGFPKKTLKVKRRDREIETDDIFLDALAKKKDKYYDKMEIALSNRNFRIMSFVFLFIILVFLFVSFYYQIVQGAYYSEKAKKNKFVFKEVEAQRGIIYDRNLKQLVSNTQSFDLICNLDLLFKEEGAGEREEVEIANILNLPLSELKAMIEKEKDKKNLLWLLI